jgi:glutamine amidotransferase PdxT
MRSVNTQSNKGGAMGCKQLSFTSENKEKNLILKQIKISNYKNVHGKQSLSLKEGVNIETIKLMSKEMSFIKDTGKYTT